MGETARRRRAPGLLLGLALAIAAAPAAAQAPDVLAKGPYLQALGPTSVTVKVELASPGRVALTVSPAGGSAPVAARASTETTTFHALHVEGLQPATAYDYTLLVSGAPRATGHFTTAPEDDRPFRFVVYGDNRSGTSIHAAVIRAIAQAPADFLVNTGDVVMSGPDPAGWRDFFAVEGTLLRDRCVFVAVGNHELARGDPAGEVAFLRYFGAEEADGRPRDRLYGTFRWSNTRFFLLNAMDQWTGEERDWLRAELDRARAEPGLAHRFAVMHWGPFSSGSHKGNPALASGEVVDMMVERGVDLLLAGHDHIYERGEGRGLKYLISGGAGAPLYEKAQDAPETRTFESVHHFVEVAVDGDHVSVVALRAGGGTIETCGFRGMGSWDCDAARPRAAAPAGGVPRTVPAVIGALVVIGGVAAALRFAARRRAGEKGA